MQGSAATTRHGASYKKKKYKKTKAYSKSVYKEPKRCCPRHLVNTRSKAI